MALGGSTAAEYSDVGGAVRVPLVLRESAQPMCGIRAKASGVRHRCWSAAVCPAPERYDESLCAGLNCGIAEECCQDER